jgi:hypothetical protein
MPILNKELKSKDFCLINHNTGCQYMFKPYQGCVKVLIDDGHGWRTYDDTMVYGNYEKHMARTFWDSLVKQGFTNDYYQDGTTDYEI